MRSGVRIVLPFAGLLLTVFLNVLVSPASAEPQQRRGAVNSIEPTRLAAHPSALPAMAALPPGIVAEAPRKSLLVGIPLADTGFPDGFRLSNLGGRREVYVPVPQGIDLSPTELVLVYDDVSAHEAHRSLEILVNDRSVAALALDGKSMGRTARISLANAVIREGFLKVSFVYSGAATQDRCIDVRYVGDSLSIRAESSVQFALGTAGAPTIAATAALMPKDVAILLSNPSPPPADIAAALTLARSVVATGRRVTFLHGLNNMPGMVERDDTRQWTRGLIVVGGFGRIGDRLDAPVATLASIANGADADNALAAARIGGVPILLITDPASSRIGRLLGSTWLAALRDTPTASVAMISGPKQPTDHISFDALGLTTPRADIFGRAELSLAVASRSLPSGTRPTRLILNVMVAPDGDGEKAVISAFINERLLASAVAAIGEPTRLDFPLPAGLVGAVANIRVVVQRRSGQSDCRAEPQGYPAEILASSEIVLAPADPEVRDFSDLAPFWAGGIQLLVPASMASHPLAILGTASGVLNALSNETAPIDVSYVAPESPATPTGPFIAVGNLPPAGADPRVRLDRGHIAITDRDDHTLLDVGGLATGAVAQIVTANGHPGLWLHPLSSDGALPVPPAISLDRGDVAFLDRAGVALALSTQRDTLLRVAYTDQKSWTTYLDRLWPWIVGGGWVLATLSLLLVMQRAYRRRASANTGK
jgi:hypothetical protein